MKVIWQAIVNLFKSLTGLVAADVQKLKDKVVALEQQVADKIQGKADDLGGK